MGDCFSKKDKAVDEAVQKTAKISQQFATAINLYETQIESRNRQLALIDGQVDTLVQKVRRREHAFVPSDDELRELQGLFHAKLVQMRGRQNLEKRLRSAGQRHSNVSDALVLNAASKIEKETLRSIQPISAESILEDEMENSEKYEDLVSAIQEVDAEKEASTGTQDDTELINQMIMSLFKEQKKVDVGDRAQVSYYMSDEARFDDDDHDEDFDVDALSDDDHSVHSYLSTTLSALPPVPQHEPRFPSSSSGRKRGGKGGKRGGSGMSTPMLAVPMSRTSNAPMAMVDMS